MKLELLIHSADPLSRLVVIIVFTRVVRLFPLFQILHNKAKKKENKTWGIQKVEEQIDSATRKDRIEKAEHDLQQGKYAFEVADKILGKCRERPKISLLEDGKEISDDKNSASVFNEFFIEKIRKLKQKIDPKLVQDPLLRVRKHSGSFSFNVVSVEHVEKIISSMKTSPSRGAQNIWR